MSLQKLLSENIDFLHEKNVENKALQKSHFISPDGLRALENSLLQPKRLGQMELRIWQQSRLIESSPAPLNKRRPATLRKGCVSLL